MVINTNVASLNAAQVLQHSQAQLSKSLARLSSGSRIVSPEDDAAGLSVSMRFDAQISRVGASVTNINNAISFCQTQDGYLSKIGKALDRMSELSMLAQDVTKSTSDMALYGAEFTALQSYVTDISTKTFNNVALFATSGGSVTIDSEGAVWTMTGVSMGVAAYTTAVSGAATSLASVAGAQAALTSVKAAISQLATDRANVGANISRLNYSVDQLEVVKTNLAAANSRIKDVDVADESTEYARYNILVQSGTAMLAQANTLPQSALKLLGQ